MLLGIGAVVMASPFGSATGVAAVLRWEEPPPASMGRPIRVEDWDRIAAELRRNPGRWALIGTGSRHTNTASQVASGRIRSFTPTGVFEARRRLVDGEVRVYARYSGEESAACAA